MLLIFVHLSCVVALAEEEDAARPPVALPPGGVATTTGKPRSPPSVRTPEDGNYVILQTALNASWESTAEAAFTECSSHAPSLDDSVPACENIKQSYLCAFDQFAKAQILDKYTFSHTDCEGLQQDLSETHSCTMDCKVLEDTFMRRKNEPGAQVIDVGTQPPGHVIAEITRTSKVGTPGRGKMMGAATTTRPGVARSGSPSLDTWHVGKCHSLWSIPKTDVATRDDCLRLCPRAHFVGANYVGKKRTCYCIRPGDARTLRRAPVVDGLVADEEGTETPGTDYECFLTGDPTSLVRSTGDTRQGEDIQSAMNDLDLLSRPADGHGENIPSAVNDVDVLPKKSGSLYIDWCLGIGLLSSVISSAGYHRVISHWTQRERLRDADRMQIVGAAVQGGVTVIGIVLTVLRRFKNYEGITRAIKYVFFAPFLLGAAAQILGVVQQGFAKGFFLPNVIKIVGAGVGAVGVSTALIWNVRKNQA